MSTSKKAKARRVGGFNFEVFQQEYPIIYSRLTTEVLKKFGNKSISKTALNTAIQNAREIWLQQNNTSVR